MLKLLISLVANNPSSLCSAHPKSPLDIAGIVLLIALPAAILPILIFFKSSSSPVFVAGSLYPAIIPNKLSSLKFINSAASPAFKIVPKAGAPIVAGLGLGRLAGGVGGGAARNVAGGAAGLAGYGGVGNEGMGGVPLPLGMGPYGTVGPTGLPLDVLSPLGPDAGRRLRTQKDAEALRDATNIVLPTIRKFSEQAKKDDFARSMASRGIAQNIATNAALTQGMAAATRQLGLTGAQQAGQALTQQYNY